VSDKRLCDTFDARDVFVCDRPVQHKGQHAATVNGKRVYWGRTSGPSKPHVERLARGLRRVDVSLGPEAQESLSKLLAAGASSIREAIESALIQAAVAPRIKNGK
jgi:hypothetical protein